MSELKTKIVIEAVDKATKPIRKTRAALEQLGGKLKAVQSFKKLKAESAANSAQLNKLRERSKALATQMNKTGASKKLTREFEANNKAAKRLKEQHKKQQVALHKLRSELKRSGIDTKKLTQHERRLREEAGRLNRQLGKQEKHFRRLRKSSSGFRRTALAGGKVLGIIGAVTTATAAIAGVGLSPLIRTAAKFEKFQVQLTAIEGTSAKAKKSLDWVSEFAKKTPFELDGVISAFVKLRAFGMDPMNGTLQAIADQTAKLGGGQQELNGIILALGQAWSKQKLQGEEALQLIERSVPVWDLLAKATGKNTAELQEMSRKGQLGRKAISLLMEEMGKASAGSALAQMKTFNGMIANLADQWMRVKLAIMDAGLFSFLKEKLSQLSGWLEKLNKSGELKTMTSSIGSKLTVALNIVLATFRALGWAIKALSFVWNIFAKTVNFILSPLRQVFNLFSDILNQVILISDKLTGLNINKAIGRTVSFVMAGLGSENAQNALANESQFQQTITPTLSSPTTLVNQQSKHQGNVNGQKTEVGGTLHIKIDSEGRPSVTKIEKHGDLDIDVDAGLVMAMP